MPRVFENSDLKLLFPENWYLSQSHQAADGIAYEITLENVAGATWSLTVCDSRQVADQFIDQTRQEIDRMYESTEWSQGGIEMMGQQLDGWNGYFFSLDLLVAVQIRSIDLDSRVCVVQTQAENAEFEQLDRVFQAITYSLLQSLATKHGSES